MNKIDILEDKEKISQYKNVIKSVVSNSNKIKKVEFFKIFIYLNIISIYFILYRINKRINQKLLKIKK